MHLENRLVDEPRCCGSHQLKRAQTESAATCILRIAAAALAVEPRCCGSSKEPDYTTSVAGSIAQSLPIATSTMSIESMSHLRQRKTERGIDKHERKSCNWLSRKHSTRPLAICVSSEWYMSTCNQMKPHLGHDMLSCYLARTTTSCLWWTDLGYGL
jgi:hypothetical protein